MVNHDVEIAAMRLHAQRPPVAARSAVIIPVEEARWALRRREKVERSIDALGPSNNPEVPRPAVGKLVTRTFACRRMDV
jgi:hypothetical protein